MFRIRHFTNLRVDDGLVDVLSLEFLHLCVVRSPVQQLMDAVSLCCSVQNEFTEKHSKINSNNYYSYI